MLPRIFIFTYLFIFLFISDLFSQFYSLSGKVTSKELKPLQGAYIIINEFKKGTTSGEDGSFTIKQIPENNFRLEIRLIGYKPLIQQVILKKDSVYNFILEETLHKLKGIEITAEQTRLMQRETPVPSKVFLPREVKYQAGGAEDVLRTLLSVPGITSQNETSVQLVIRGSNPEQNLMLMDGIEIFNPYRFYGLVSMYNPELISDISLIPGGFSVKYSDRLSAVIDVTQKNGFNNEVNKPKIFSNVNLTNMNIVTELKLKLKQDEDLTDTNELNTNATYGSFIMAFRRTYYDLISKPIIKSLNLVKGDFILPNFNDFQFKFSLQPSYKSKFILNTLINNDETIVNEFNPSDYNNDLNRITINDRTYNNLLSSTFIYNHSSSFIGQYSLSYYRYGGWNNGSVTQSTLFSLGEKISEEEYQKIADSLKMQGIDILPLLRSSAEFSFEFNRLSFKADYYLDEIENNLIEFGIIYDNIYSDIDLEFNLDPRKILSRPSSFRFSIIPPELVSEIKTWRLGGFIMDKIDITKKFKVQPGLRYDYYKIINKDYFSPRLSFSYLINEFITLKGAWGLYFQSPGYEKIFNTNPEMYLKTNLINLSPEYTKSLKAEKAIHYNLSLDLDLSEQYNLRIEGYTKFFNDLIYPKVMKGVTYKSDLLNPSAPKDIKSWSMPYPVIDDSVTSIPSNDGQGFSRGIEITFRKEITNDSPDFYGWIAYSYLTAKRTWLGIEYPFNFERTHNFNLTLGYRLGDWGDLNVSFQYGTGFPVTLPIGSVPRIYLKKDTITNVVSPVIETGVNGVVFDPSYGKINDLNKGRLPDYHKLDLRITTYPNWFGWNWRIYLDIINLYNHKNVINKNFYINNQTLKPEEIETSIFPVLPTLGLTIFFN